VIQAQYDETVGFATFPGTFCHFVARILNNSDNLRSVGSPICSCQRETGSYDVRVGIKPMRRRRAWKRASFRKVSNSGLSNCTGRDGS